MRVKGEDKVFNLLATCKNSFFTGGSLYFFIFFFRKNANGITKAARMLNKAGSGTNLLPLPPPPVAKAIEENSTITITTNTN